MRRTPAIAAVLFALSTPLFAQTIESSVGIRVNFEAAGARGAAMGGTAEALTDVFAATTNPAALAKQRRRAGAVELRHASSSTEFLSGFENDDVTSKRNGIGGATVVVPTRNATFAISYDEPLNARGNPGPRGDAPNMRVATSLRRLGAAAAWSRGNLSLGAALQLARLDRSLGFNFGGPPGATPIGITSGDEVTWSTGLQWQFTPSLRAGASYRSGSEFKEPYQLNFAIPSSFGAGLAADLGPNVTLAADAVRVRYSESLGFGWRDPGVWDFSFPDVTELHAGAEWRLTTRVPVALRAGWWHDPAHRMNAFTDTDQNHVTAGVGIGNRVKLDAAFDRSQKTRRASLAVTTNF